MSVTETITQPWRHPVDYVKLAFFVVLFLVVASIIYEGVALFTKGMTRVVEGAAS